MRQALTCGAKISKAAEKANKHRGSTLSLNSSGSEPQASEIEAASLSAETDEDKIPVPSSPKRDRQK